MPGLGPGIHVLLCRNAVKAWIPAPSAGMTAYFGSTAEGNDIRALLSLPHIPRIALDPLQLHIRLAALRRAALAAAQITRHRLPHRLALLLIDRGPARHLVGFRRLDRRAAGKLEVGNALTHRLRRCAGIGHAAHPHHVAALLVVRIEVEQVVADVFHHRLDLLAGHPLHIDLRIGDGRLPEHILHGQCRAGEHRRPPAKAGRQRDLGIEFAAQGVADQLVHGAVEVAAAEQQPVGDSHLLVEGFGMRRVQLCDQGFHLRIGFQAIAEHRQQTIANVLHPTFAELQVKHAQELAVGAGVADQRLAAGIAHRDRLRHRVVGVAAENDIDASDAAGELEIDIHAVVRQQHHRVDLFRAAQMIDQLLQFIVAHAEGPVRHKTFGVRDRHIGEGLADDGEPIIAEWLDRIGLEHTPGRLVEGLCIVERRFLGEEHVLRQELTLEVAQILAQHILAVGELPVPGHGVDAKQVGGRHHVGALHGVGKPAALPEITAVEQNGVAGRHRGAQLVDQRLEMRKATQAAVAPGVTFEVEKREGMGLRAVARHAELLEKRLSHQMRRPAAHGADADIDAGLAKMHRLQLRMGVRHVQHARIAEWREVVHGLALRRRGADARQAEDRRRCQRQLQEVASVEWHG